MPFSRITTDVISFPALLLEGREGPYERLTDRFYDSGEAAGSFQVSNCRFYATTIVVF